MTDRDASVRRYRQASETLDERPSAAARAAILAAAARHVEARPQAAQTPRPASRRRWPLAAAAAVLLSTLAVMMATRTEQEMPVFTAPEERQAAPAPAAPAPSIATPSASTAADSAASAPSPRTTAKAPLSMPAPTARVQKEAVQDRRTEPAPAPRIERPPAVPDVAADSASPASESQSGGGAASAEATRALPAAPAAAPAPAPAPPPSAAQGTAPATAGGARDAAKTGTAPAQERALRREAAPAPQALPPRELSAQEWLERIVRLRAAGREGEADAELKRFRERYPEIRVPPEALPGGAGTR